MRKRTRSFCAVIFVGALLPALTAAQEQGLLPLSRAVEAATVAALRFGALRPQAPPRREWSGIDLGALPSPDAATLSWLAGRVPGLETSRVRQVPFVTAEAVMRKAVELKLTYLQFLTQDLFKGDAIYYAPKDVIERIDQLFVTGMIPFSGKTNDGRPFKMIAFAGGHGSLHILYDIEQDFRFPSGADDRDFMIKNRGHIAAQIQAPGDITAQGLHVHAFMDMFTEIQRIAQTGPATMHITTSMGSGDGAIGPIRAK